MKRILLSGVAVAVVSSLAGCSPYYWEDNYQGDRVNLDGPLRRNIEYVSGGTTFSAPDQAVRVESVAAGSPAATNFRVAPQQVTIQQAAAPVGQAVISGAQGATQTIFASTTGQIPAGAIALPAGATLPAGAVAFAAPSTATTIAPANSTISQVNLVTQPAAAFTQAANTATNAVVPAAYANAGDAANLQTRRVGDVGLIVFSNLIADATAKGAAQRSCAQISKTAVTSEPSDIQLGVRQLNFRCS